MIRDFKDEETKEVFLHGRSRKFGNIARVAARRLGAIHFAISLDALREPPSNHLEKLKGDRAGQYSIRINDQYRVCFRCNDGDAFEVEIVDYH